MASTGSVRGLLAMPCGRREPDGAISLLQGELLSPCRCDGSVKCTHQPCLIKWISERGCWSCELCYYKYHVIAISTKNPLQVKVLETFQSLFILGPLSVSGSKSILLAWVLPPCTAVCRKGCRAAPMSPMPSLVVLGHPSGPCSFYLSSLTLIPFSLYCSLCPSIPWHSTGGGCSGALVSPGLILSVQLCKQQVGRIRM